MKLLQVDDVKVQENFKRINQEINVEQPLLRSGMKFFKITFAGAVTNFKFKHNLGFVPKDVIQTALSGTAALIWNYDLFDSNYLDITTSDACTVRAFIGTYKEGDIF